MWTYLLFAFMGWGAPHPGTSTSVLADPYSGNYLSRLGFTVRFPKNWAFLPQEMSSHSLNLKLSNPLVSGALINVQASTLDKKIPLEKYVRSWMKDYTNYGFQVLSTKALEHRGRKGVLVDIYHQQKHTQSRQVLFMQEKTPIVITCLAPASKFPQIISACDQSILSLKWVDTFALDAPKR